MSYFLILFTLITFTYIFDFGKIQRGKRFAFLFSLIILILFSGLRYRVGFDTIRYMKVFENSIPTFRSFDYSYIFINRHEPLFLLLEIIAKSIYPQFITVQILQATILNISIFYFIKQNTKYVFTGVLFYFMIIFVSFNFETIRQAISVALFLFSVSYLQHKKWLKYFLLATVALLFHTSAILLFILPFLTKVLKYKYLVLYMVSAAFASLFISNNFSSVLNLLAVNDQLALKAAKYAINEHYSGQRLNIIGTITHIIINIFIPYFLLRLNRKWNTFEKFQFEHFIILYIIISILMIKVQLFYRILDYFYPFLIILLTTTIGNFVFNCKRYSMPRTISQVMIITFLVFKIYGQFFGSLHGIKNYHRYFPYSSVLTKKEAPKRESMLWKDFNTK